MKNILLIGLGRFGRHMAQALTDLHHQVLVIDKDEHKVQEAMSYVTNAEAGKGLIKCAGNIVPFESGFPKDTKLYQLMTTKPKEAIIE